MSNAELALAIAGITLQICLLVLLLRGAHRGQFVAFVAYTAFSVVSTTVALAVRNHPATYLRVYWGSEALYTLFAFLALHEIFQTVFKNFYRLPWFRFLFPGIGVLMTVIAVLRAVLRPLPAGSWKFATIISLEIGIGFLQIGIFFLFILLVRFFRVRYRQHAFGIALGFGVLAAGSLVVYLLRSEFGKKFDPVVRITPPITYTVALVVWLVTFLVKEPGPPQPGVALGLTPEQMVSDLKRYTAVAKRIFRQ
jgi:hypothetical protein